MLIFEVGGALAVDPHRDAEAGGAVELLARRRERAALETGEAGGVIERGRVRAGARECYRDEEGGEEAAHSGGAAVVLSLCTGASTTTAALPGRTRRLAGGAWAER